MLLFIVSSLYPQQKVFRGIVLDKQSYEPIPYVSIVFANNGRGTITDSAGKFTLALSFTPDAGDSIKISTTGYKTTTLPWSVIKDSSSLTVFIEVLPPQVGVVVKTKYNRALWFWRKIMANKYKHEKGKFNNFSYEVYNKLELDLYNVNKDKLEKNGLLKPFNFIFNNIDSTTEERPFLPAYLTETLSDYYYQKQPYKTREVIKATNAYGFVNESLRKQLGATYQNVDVYANNIPVFDKQFISPFSTNADNYYTYKLADTQYLGGKRLVHFLFHPKRPGENTFEGDCWVNDTAFALQKITLRPSLDANINFVTGLTLIQEFKLINDTTWFLYKDKFVVDFSPLGNEKLSFKGRKTATYEHVLVNNDSITNELAKSRVSEDILEVPNTLNMPDSFWVQNRHEPLSKNEQNILKTIDTLQHNKTFIHYKNAIDFLTTGTKYVGPLVIGPWYYWVSGNPQEGTRVRWDLATNRSFSEHWYLHGYAAYGFTDQKWKGKAEIKYQFSRKPWSYITAMYKSDLDNGVVHYDELGSDNVFSIVARKPGIPFKYQRITQSRFEYFQETNKSFAFGISADSKHYEALRNLPGADLYPKTIPDGNPFSTFEAGIRLRYAYQERYIESNFDRGSLGSQYPIIELKYAHGFKGVNKSSYDYDKIDLSIRDNLTIQPYGTLYYNFFAGKVFGTLPYQMLDIQPGNEWYYYSRYSFNLMNRFEYLTDQYAGFNIEHNVGSGLFRFIPLTRKWKFRQFWEAKGVVGGLSDANKNLNFVGDHPFKSLDNKLYLELGTGVDNIFKLFRVDAIWRITPRPLPSNAVQRFGVFFGFRVSL